MTVATNMAGRGVDIILGGNPEGLAVREAKAHGIDSATEEGAAERPASSRVRDRARPRARRSVPRVASTCWGASATRAGASTTSCAAARAGRGIPGESRFFLSLEDDLMRLFATGAMNWVMGRALPDDMPIEAKMVTKAIERAQNTVEGRNAESRKDVLKYDDVMNEQRKVIYAGATRSSRATTCSEDTVELLEMTLTEVVARRARRTTPRSGTCPD